MGAIIHSKWLRWKTKVPLVFAIAIVATLVAIVGPASAACMIPRNNFWPLGSGILLINASVGDIFPSNVTASQYADYSYCDQRNYGTQTGFQGTCSWSRDTLGLNSLLSLGLNIGRWQRTQTLSLGRGNWSVHRSAPISDYTLGDEQPSLAFSTNITYDQSNVPIHVSTSTQAMGLWPFSVSTYQPWLDIDNVYDALSRVEIRSSPVWWNLTQSQPSFSFGPTQNNLTVISSEDLLRIRAELKNISFAFAAYNTFVFADLDNDSTYGMVLVSGNAAFGSTYELEGLWLTPVSFVLGWMPSKWQQRAIDVGSNASLNVEDPGFRRVRVASDWMDTINPWLSNMNASLYNYFTDYIICQSGPNCGAVRGSPLNPSLLLSALLTATLSKMMPEPGQCDEWAVWTPLEGIGGCGTDQDRINEYTSQWPMKFYRPGYGYGPDILAVRLSLAILILYSTIAVAHIIYSVWTGISSWSWDSISEIMALCINSRPAPELQNTCAGIRLAKVFESRVRVAATRGVDESHAGQDSGDDEQSPGSKGSHLELLFGSGEQAAVSGVKINEAYGALEERRQADSHESR